MINTVSMITSLINDSSLNKYILPGSPMAWKRAGLCKSRFYDQQTHVKMAKGCEMNLQRNGAPTLMKPIRLIAMFYMPMPNSWSPKKRDLMRGKHCPTTPDNTNMMKLIEDIAVEVQIMRDDALIASHFYDKIYDDNPRTEFILQEIE
jgi:Holliday junction resolvase RusA-like endonuclease